MSVEEKRVVIVEDDEAFGFALQSALSAVGCVVTRLSDHEAFLKLAFEGQAADADLFLVDVQLPGLFGDSVTRIFLKSGPISEIPVLLISGLGEEELKSRAEEAGANGYICKSWGIKQIVEHVKQVLQGTNPQSRESSAE